MTKVRKTDTSEMVFNEMTLITFEMFEVITIYSKMPKPRHFSYFFSCHSFEKKRNCHSYRYTPN